MPNRTLFSQYFLVALSLQNILNFSVTWILNLNSNDYCCMVICFMKKRSNYWKRVTKPYKYFFSFSYLKYCNKKVQCFRGKEIRLTTQLTNLLGKKTYVGIWQCTKLQMYLKYGFCKKLFGTNEPLTSWKLLSSIFFQISADLEKNWGQKCSTGQRFICTEVTSYKIHILGTFVVWCIAKFLHKFFYPVN